MTCTKTLFHYLHHNMTKIRISQMFLSITGIQSWKRTRKSGFLKISKKPIFCNWQVSTNRGVFFYSRKTFLPSEMGIFSNLIMAKANPIIYPNCHMCATLRVFLYIFKLAGLAKLLRTEICVLL